MVSVVPVFHDDGDLVEEPSGNSLPWKIAICNR